ncbi:hypothetical protein BJX99DRAFT_235437 [Aspergillus californicus]
MVSQNDGPVPSQPLYASGGLGLMRYLFLYGNHSGSPCAESATVHGRVVVYSRLGDVVYNDKGQNTTSKYEFLNGRCTLIDGKPNPFLPARVLTEKLILSVSIPAVVLAEVPASQTNLQSPQDDNYVYVVISVLGRDDHSPITSDDETYIRQMMHTFVPVFIQAVASKSQDYLPGDVQSMCRDIAAMMMSWMDKEEQKDDLTEFLDLYRRRYFYGRIVHKKAVLESCLVHILKMPFELNASIKQGLIR